MRVVLVATSYPAVVGDPSGHFVRAEALSLVEQGHEVHVVAPSPLCDDGISVHPAGGATLFTWPGAAARARRNPLLLAGAATFFRGAVQAIRTIAPDKVIAHWMVPGAWPITTSAVQRSCAIEIVCHGADVRLLCELPSDVRHHVVKTILERGPAIRFVASSLREALLASLDEPVAARVMSCSRVAPPHVSVRHREAPAVGRDRFAVAAARLIPSKRVDLAIEATARNAASRLVVLGDGPDRSRLESIARRLCPDRVSFHGTLPRPVALGWIAAASALVHLSEVDAAPTVVLEARALETPVIAADVGAVRDWAQLDSGIVVVPREADHVSNVLGSFLRG